MVSMNNSQSSLKFYTISAFLLLYLEVLLDLPACMPQCIAMRGSRSKFPKNERNSGNLMKRGVVTS